jgi:hypothetical protein
MPGSGSTVGGGSTAGIGGGGGSGGRKAAEIPDEPPVVLPQRFIIEERIKEVEQLKLQQTTFEAKIQALSDESRELAQQKAAITSAIEALRQGLKFESTISAKVFFGQDAAKDSDDNLALQVCSYH